MSETFKRFESKVVKKLEQLLELIMENQEAYGNFSTETGEKDSLFTKEELKTADAITQIKDRGIGDMPVDQMLEHFNRVWKDQVKIKEEGIESHDPIWHKVDPLIPKNKIKAIKEYRSITGKGLKESKKAVDERQQKLGLYRN
jgi:C-terminal processing protease CtpA/Prc